MGAERTIGSVLLERLQALGVRHIFGIPGDYVLSLYQLIERSPIKHVGTTREDAAGFAADAYARIHGIGAVCVTYCVGGFNALNPIAGAYAERSPVILLSGSPGLNERRQHQPFFHHMVRDFNTQKEVFEKVTVAAAILDDPVTAEREMDRAFAALLRYRRPIYLEIPRDQVHTPIAGPPAPPDLDTVKSHPDALQEAVAEVRSMLSSANRPVVLLGEDAYRFGLQDTLVKLVERMNVPVAATLLGKSVVREDHPLYIGIYSGLIGRDEVQQFVTQSDCLLMLGALVSDIERDAAQDRLLAEGRTIHVTADAITIKHHRYDQVRFEDFVQALAAAPLPVFPARTLPPIPDLAADKPAPTDRVTLKGMFGYLDSRLTESTLVIADIGEALFAAADLRVHRGAEFLSPAYYTSMGFAVPAALGAGFADPALRPIVLVGDGAFQMTGTELSSCVRYKLAPIVIILNNRGYSTEREIMAGGFNDIHNWQFERLCDLIGGGVGHRIATHGEFVQALDAALANRASMHLLNVLLDPSDRSPAMVRLAKRLAKRLSPGK